MRYLERRNSKCSSPFPFNAITGEICDQQLRKMTKSTVPRKNRGTVQNVDKVFRGAVPEMFHIITESIYAE